MSLEFSIEDLDKRLSILKLSKYPGLLDELASASDKLHVFRNWTPLKLVALSYVVGPYLRIIGGLEKRKGRVDAVYIDLFAGSGINKVEGSESLIAGSPIVAVDCANTSPKKFDRMYFVDLEEGNIRALHTRLKLLSEIDEFSWIKNRCKFIIGDANDAISKIRKELDKLPYKNYLALVDPYKWEFRWGAFEKLLEIPYGDVLVTFQATLIAKEIGKYNSVGLSGETIKTISECLGASPEEWSLLGKEEILKNYYIEKIKEYKNYVVDIMVKGKVLGGPMFKYFLIFASGREDPPWKSWIERMKEFVERYSGDIVEDSLKYLDGKSTRLTDYIREKQQESEKKKSRNLSLDEFF